MCYVIMAADDISEDTIITLVIDIREPRRKLKREMLYY